MSGKHRHHLLNEVRKELRARKIPSSVAAKYLLDVAVSCGLVDSSKYLTGTQFDLLCSPSSGKRVNQWLACAAAIVIDSIGITISDADANSAYEEAKQHLVEKSIDTTLIPNLESNKYVMAHQDVVGVA